MSVQKPTINELLNLDIMDFNTMTEKEMRKVVSRLRDAANKKVKRLEKTGIDTPALRQVQRSGGLFSTKGKTLNELRAEHARIRSFMTAKTSTKTGYEQVRNETLEGLKNEGVNLEYDDKKIRRIAADRGITTEKGIEKLKKELNSKEAVEKRLDGFFKVYDKLKEIDPSITMKNVKYEVMREISQRIEDNDFEGLILQMQEQLDDIYEATAGAIEDFESISDFFEY